MGPRMLPIRLMLLELLTVLYVTGFYVYYSCAAAAADICEQFCCLIALGVVCVTYDGSNISCQL